MTWSVVEKAQVFIDSVGNSLSTPAFAWDADRLLVAFYMGKRTVGEFDLSFVDSTGLGMEEVTPRAGTTFSTSTMALGCHIAKTPSSGSGSVSISTSLNVSGLGIHVFEVDGFDPEAADGLDAIVQDTQGNTTGSQATLTVPFEQPASARSLILAGGASVTSNITFNSLTDLAKDSGSNDTPTFLTGMLVDTPFEELVATNSPQGGGFAVKLLELRGLPLSVHDGASGVREVTRELIRGAWQVTPHRLRSI